MKHFSALLSATLFVALLSLPVHASNLDLYDIAISTSTGVTGDWQDVSANDPTALPGVSTSMVCCGDATGGTTPGLGNYVYTFNGAAGTYHVTLYFNYNASTPYFNEFGTINNGASAQSGITYEVFNALSTTGNIVLFPANGTHGGEVYGSADGLNHVPGGTDNFLATCTAVTTCNGDVGLALTYTFSLGNNEQAVITAASSTTNPGGFSLETTHPVDANNTSASSVYLTGSLAIQDIVNNGTPEPSTWSLLGAGILTAGLSIARSRRRS